jgi:hypothetical protein
METIYEFRIREKHANRLFGPNEGKKLGWTKKFKDEFVMVRKVELYENDPRLRQVGEINTSIKKELNDFFFAGWAIRRRYSPDDLKEAKFFSFVVWRHLSQQVKNVAPYSMNLWHVHIVKAELNRFRLYFLIGTEFLKKTSPEQLLVKL